MNFTELKKKLSRLWKNTFNGTEEYVSLIFNNLFDPEYVVYEQEGDEVVAAIIGIPYEFGNADHRVKGLYLCGMATVPQFRSRGIMTRLLAKINQKARETGFCFSFLICADAGLRKFFRDRDYVNAFYHVIDNYTSLHDFTREYESILLDQNDKVAELKRRLFASLKPGVFDPDAPSAADDREGMRTLIRGIEDTQQDLQLIHSDLDIDLIIEENSVSGGKIYYVRNGSGKVTGVAFTTISEGTVNINKLFASDMASKYKLFDIVKTCNRELGIRHFVSSIEMDRAALWLRTYGSVNPAAGQVPGISITERVYSLAAHAKVFGMVRILNFAEILKFQAECRSDLKYSILVKGETPYTFEQIKVRDGNVSIKQMSIESNSENRGTHVMTKRDIGEILFRRRDTDNMITEAFGIPSINGAICLLPE